jgi:hypothetical protein
MALQVKMLIITPQLATIKLKNGTGAEQQSPIHSLSTELIDGQAKTI